MPTHQITPSPSRILYVAYPLLTISETSAGGAEQVLWTLEREMAGRGSRTTVAASSGSQISGELFSTGDACTQTDDFERRNREHQDKIVQFVRRRRQQGRPFDLIHDMSGSFWTRALEIEAPVLATLHLPRHFYQPEYFESIPANVAFNCVSAAQARSFNAIEQMMGVVPNGIPLDHFDPNYGKRQGLLWLGRICEEKGPHLALDIAARSGWPIVIAGQVYPFSYHRQFFDREIEPRLRQNPNAQWIDSPSAPLKCDLLRSAAALLITSLVNETSSLVAMEAAACGTPVIAFRRGAIPEVVKNGITGFVVDGIQEAVEALKRLPTLSSIECHRHAMRHFSGERMANVYERLYTSLLSRRARTLNAA